MSLAEELLNSYEDEEEIVAYSDDEPHIVVNADRTITVPDVLKSIAVQYDNNVETVTFDCPRYWDEHDFSTMHIYINFTRPDGYMNNNSVKNIRVSDTDDSIIHFDWTLGEDVTRASGKLSILVCIKNLETDLRPHWNSRINQDLTIEPGMEMYTAEAETSPATIATIVERIEKLEVADHFVLIDRATAIPYELYVENGKLMMVERGE